MNVTVEVMGNGDTITRRRRGCVSLRIVKGIPYWQADVMVDGRRMYRGSKDRAVCEAWLAEVLREHPTYEQRVRVRRSVAEWCVVAECDPLTAAYHMVLKHDRRIPEKVLLRDTVNDVPIMWVEDDNGGRGHMHRTAWAVARRMNAGGGWARHSVRRMSDAWRRDRKQHHTHTRQQHRIWQGG